MAGVQLHVGGEQCGRGRFSGNSGPCGYRCGISDRTGGLPTSPDIMTRHIHTGSGVTPTETTGETI